MLNPLALSLLFLSVAANGMHEEPPVLSERVRVLSVTGQGEVGVAPDRATVEIAVTHQAPTAGDAQEGVNLVVHRVLEALSRLGIDTQQIQTSRLYLQPVFSNPRAGRGTEGRQIVEYNASHYLSVRTDNLAQISSIVDVALEQGANQLQGVRYDLKDEGPAREEALRRAVAAAAAKAEVIARAARIELGRIVEVAEGAAAVRPASLARSAVMSAEAGGAPTPVMTGQVIVTASVTIRYELGVSPP